jgi:hypothetical protein
MLFKFIYLFLCEAQKMWIGQEKETEKIQPTFI